MYDGASDHKKLICCGALHRYAVNICSEGAMLQIYSCAASDHMKLICFGAAATALHTYAVTICCGGGPMWLLTRGFTA